MHILTNYLFWTANEIESDHSQTAGGMGGPLIRGAERQRQEFYDIDNNISFDRIKFVTKHKI